MTASRASTRAIRNLRTVNPLTLARRGPSASGFRSGARRSLSEPFVAFSTAAGQRPITRLMRAALHVTLTPIVFLFGWTMLSAAWAPWPVRTVGAIAAAVGGVAYGWKNRHR